MYSRLGVVLSFLFSLLICCNSEEAPITITIDVPGLGNIRGYSNGHSWQFYGIPFAKPPVGRLRWKDPEEPEPWSGVFDAKNVPAGCPQNCKGVLPDIVCPGEMSEDCLYLNIFVPLSYNTTSKFDVMLYIYGGAFIYGTSGCTLFDSRYFSEYTNTIIVTFNYRLGVLGFLRNPAYGIKGNMGLRDQRLAMKWVRNHISAFGGSSITLFGESAGAMSVGVHMVSPLSQGLFDTVIIQSNPFGMPFKTKTQAGLNGIDFMLELKCFLPFTNCKYEKSMDDILAVQKKYFPIFGGINDLYNIINSFIIWAPIIDNVDLDDQPLTILSNNPSLAKPGVIGTTTDEGLSFVAPIFEKSILSPKLTYDILMRVLFRKSRIIKEYYKKDFTAEKGYRGLFAQILSDFAFYCPTRFLVNKLSKHQNIWTYLWNRKNIFEKPADVCYDQPCHASELIYEFNTSQLAGFKFSSQDQKLSKELQTYFGNMAKYNDTNGKTGDANFPNWPKYDTSDGSAMFFDIPKLSIESNYKKKYCDFLEENTKVYDVSKISGASKFKTFLGGSCDKDTCPDASLPFETIPEDGLCSVNCVNYGPIGAGVSTDENPGCCWTNLDVAHLSPTSCTRSKVTGWMVDRRNGECVCGISHEDCYNKVCQRMQDPYYVNITFKLDPSGDEVKGNCADYI